jgi:RNA polymerase sigma-70 factor, ECF subfamily
MLEFLGASRAQAGTGDRTMTEAGQSGDRSKANRAESAAATPAEGSLSAQFTHLYRQYVTPIYSYIFSRTGNRADAEDLTEVVFTEALEGLARYEEQGKEAAWLFTIAHRRIVDHYRSRRDELPLDAALDSPLDNPGPEAAVAQGERLAKLARLVAALDDDKRELLQLRFVAGLSYAEIGAVVGSSEGAVKIAIYRLLDQLRARWPVAGLIGHGNQEVTKDE